MIAHGIGSTNDSVAILEYKGEVFSLCKFVRMPGARIIGRAVKIIMGSLDSFVISIK